MRLLMAGVASGTLVLTAVPAALAFNVTGSPNPTSWRWGEVTDRLAGCTSRGGLGNVVNCRPAEAVDLPSYAYAPEEHRKGRRVVVLVPVPTEAAQPSPQTVAGARPSPRPKHRASSTLAPVTAPKESPTPSPSPSERPHADDEGGGRD